jgi:hypothetical protein
MARMALLVLISGFLDISSHTSRMYCQLSLVRVPSVALLIKESTSDMADEDEELKVVDDDRGIVVGARVISMQF